MSEAIKRALNSIKPEDHDMGTSTQQMPSSQGQQQMKSKSKKSTDISSLPVEKQFETDYDKEGHLVPDPVHFDKENDMVRASLDDFIDHDNWINSLILGCRLYWVYGVMTWKIDIYWLEIVWCITMNSNNNPMFFCIERALMYWPNINWC